MPASSPNIDTASPNPTARRTIYAREVAGVRVAFHTEENPTDAEWSDALEWTRRKLGQPEVIRILVLSDGGAPSAKQRGDFAKLVGKHSVRTSLISDSALVRGVLTAMSWFTSDMKPFGPKEIDAAMKFLGIAPSDFSIFHKAIGEIRREMEAARTRP